MHTSEKEEYHGFETKPEMGSPRTVLNLEDSSSWTKSWPWPWPWPRRFGA